MGYSEKFKFPEQAFKDFLAIHDNICGDPELENMTGLPKWFRSERGINTSSDILKLYNLWDWYELDTVFYREDTGIMEIGDGGTESEYHVEAGVICEILASVMRHYNIPDTIVIRESINDECAVLETGFGGIVHVINRDGYRKLTTDWLAEQALSGKL